MVDITDGYNIYSELCGIREIKEEELKLKKKEIEQLELRNKIEIQKIAIEQERNIVDLTKKIEGIELG